MFIEGNNTSLNIGDTQNKKCNTNLINNNSHWRTNNIEKSSKKINYNIKEEFKELQNFQLEKCINDEEKEKLLKYKIDQLKNEN